MTKKRRRKQPARKLPDEQTVHVVTYEITDAPILDGRYRRLPLLPVEADGRLNDVPLRENFIERVFAYYRWTRMLKEEATPGGLVKFHTAYKLTLMAHSPAHYTELGRLVARAGSLPWDDLVAMYGAMLMEGLTVLGTRGKHVNVLQHLMGYLKNDLAGEDRQELLGLTEDYRQELVPLVVPLT
jgi:uncharacterized protein YbgA (DUF1722 family)